ncbi:MAG: GDSL-type esterase/lipase family protein [Roseiarcus sp.]
MRARKGRFSSVVNHDVFSWGKPFLFGDAMSLRRFVVCFLLVLAAPSAALAEDGVMIGDSLGVGVNWAAKLPSQAKNSVAIYNGWVLEQLRQAPRGATVFMSLGTNDAIGNALNVKKPVETIVATAESQGLKLVWMGPPCVLPAWEAHAKQLDEILAAQLAGTPVQYVSMQDPGLCDRSLRAPDGVHFNMAGYTRMWQKAASAAGFPVVVAAASEHKPVAPASKKTPGKKRHKKKKPVAQPATHTTPAPN